MPTQRMPVLPIVSEPPAWPHRDLDVEALLAQGWQPIPIRDVVLKVHQRCNLACDYCYVYTMADQSWRDRPLVMERRTWRTAARRMAEHAALHALPSMRLVLHGGEPLLPGVDRLAELVDDFRAAFSGGCRLDVVIQTNGVLLDERTLAVLLSRDVRVGVSLDGTPEANDRRRRRPDGRGSHAAVARALRLLTAPEHRNAFAGLLCTIDPGTDPIACYEALLEYAPPTLDLLLPHANWATPPDRSTGPTPYADWLIAVFERWYAAPRQETGVRLFEDIMTILLGGASRSEQVGLSPVAVLVVETDGAIEQVDSLKSSYPNACATGRSVFTDPLDAALAHPGVVARQIGIAALCETCLACPVHAVCGGGHYAHRYRPGTGFRNPSIYCADMLRLIRHISGRMTADLHRLSALQPS
ncbi:FxsB family cyclophane-forming radical SAM/SPASM peptide maturase [Dactylosporangium sp. CA-092794]|uniref:FxsB family cyclophane-forming radical SAM/SPASM peptide maturase n=1 Tax=Dactylosporangium sp. CA-092794 TaxID=3239929 RepID=UPI003D8D3BB2